MKEKKIRLKTVQAAKDFVAEAMKCDFDIDVYYNSKFIDGKSIIGTASAIFICVQKMIFIS